MTRSLVFALIVAVVSVASCSTTDSTSPSCDTPARTTTIDMQDVAFAPDCVAASAADTLSLVNHDQMAHTYTVKGTSINVDIDPGQTAQAPLSGTAPGTYSVFCTYHPSMTASLQVT